MRKTVIILLALLVPLSSVLAQKSRRKQKARKTQKVQKVHEAVGDAFCTAFTAYMKVCDSVIVSNRLTSPDIRQMMCSTFRDKQGDEAFTKALDEYFPTMCDKDVHGVLASYYGRFMTAGQLDSLALYEASDGFRRTNEGLVRCSDAQYRDQMAGVALDSIAARTGKKRKKKNLKKFVSDCTAEYRAATAVYARAAGSCTLQEVMVNAMYHTVSLDDLNAYNAYLLSDALAARRKADAAVKDDLYDIQGTLLADFQTWTYTAYPSLFTKKQVEKKKKGRKGKAVQAAQDSDEVINGVWQ